MHPMNNPGRAQLPPILFEPVFKEKLWGGRALETRLGKRLPPGVSVGESWEISGHGDDVTRALTPPVAGQSLTQIIGQHPGFMGGRPAAPEAGFPLLYKFIDANDKLSVQVHPDDHAATANGWDSRGKTECWYIVDARPGAQIIVGFRKGVSTETVRRAVADGTLERILNYIPITAGDLLFIPAGTVHAILDGTLLFEIQESSDVTFRLFDWNRTDPSGRPRDLHVARSLQVLDTACHDRHKIPPVTVSDTGGVTRLMRAACRYFAIEEYVAAAAAAATLPVRDSFQAVTMIDGAAALHTAAGTAALSRGGTCFIPAAPQPASVACDRPARFLVTWIPDLRTDIVAPLRAAGVTDRDILLLGGFETGNDIAPAMR